MCMLVFVFLFLYIFILECTWFILWEQVASWSHDAAMDATPQDLQTQLKKDSFSYITVGRPISVRWLDIFCQDGISSLLLPRNNFIAVREWFISVWFAFAGSQSCRDHILHACLFYKREMQMSSLYKQVKGVCLGLPGWELKITTHPRLAVALHLENWSKLYVLSAAALRATLQLIPSFCAGREGSLCFPRDTSPVKLRKVTHQSWCFTSNRKGII